MSQTVPPPTPDQPAPPTATAPEATPQEPMTVLAILPPRPPAPVYVYESEPPRQQARFWRAVKWPIRKLLKAIVLVGRAAGRRKLVSLAVLLMLIGIGAIGYASYRAANPAPAVTVSISDATRPILPDSVKHWLHGYANADAAEMWHSISPNMQSTLEQNSSGEDALQSALDQNKSSHVSVNYHYTGGYKTAQGTSYYIVEVNMSGDQGTAEDTWYFVVDDSTGQIAFWQNITPQSTSSSSGSSGTPGTATSGG